MTRYSETWLCSSNHRADEAGGTMVVENVMGNSKPTKYHSHNVASTVQQVINLGNVEEERL